MFDMSDTTPAGRYIMHYYGITPTGLAPSDEDFLKRVASPNHAWHRFLSRFREQQGYNFEVHLLTEDPRGKVAKVNGIEFIVHSRSLKLISDFKIGVHHRSYFFSFDLLRYIQRHCPDLFVFYGVFSRTSPYLALWLYRKKIPFIMMYHGQTISSGLLWRWFHQRAQAVVVLSEYQKSCVVQKFDINAHNVHVIPPGIDSHIFYKIPDVAKNTYPILCSVGRIDENKSFLEALDCFRLVLNEFPGARYEVAGSFSTDEYKRVCLKFIKDHGMEQSVVFYGWLNELRELTFLYNCADLLLLPSKKEGFPRVVVEAMMCGTPAAALAKACALSGIITDEQDGLLCEPDKWKEKVLTLLRDLPRLKKMGQFAMETAKQYSFQTMYSNAESLYLGLLNRL